MVTEMVGGAVKLFSDFSDKLHERMLNNINPNSDQNRPIGTEAIVDGKRVYWSGENYGWQSKGSYNKLKNSSEFRAGHIALSRVGSSINRAVASGFSQLPEPIKDTAKDVAGKAVETYQSLPDPVQDTIEYGINTASAINEEVSRITNISPIITGEVLTAGTGKVAGKLIHKGGTVSLTYAAKRLDAPPAYALTLKNKANIPSGIKQGSAWSPEWIAQTRDYYQRRANIKERLQAAVDRKSKNVVRYKDEMHNTVSTGQSRNPDLNPEAYGDAKRFDKFKEQSEVTPLTSLGNVKWQQQHHLFSKQESYQFVERMIELGDDDDVLAMFIMAEDMDAALGGRLSNMLNMEDLPHSVLHGSRITDKRQLQSTAMRNLVENAKSSDELMTIFRQYITDNVKPSKEEAKALKIIGQRLMKIDKFGEMEQIRDKMYRN